MIDIKLLGRFCVEDADGQPINVPGAKTQGLLAFLAMTTDRPPTRDQIIAHFWGDRFSDQARQSLRQAIAKLRRILPSGDAEALIVDQDRIGLNRDVFRVDVDRLQHLATSEDEAEVAAAVELLRGPLLDGLFGQQPVFEDWIAGERLRMAELSARVLEKASGIARRSGELERALNHARRVVELDPWSDAAQMGLLRLMAESGNRAQAIQTFKAYETTLDEELGIAPGQELQDLMAQIRHDRLPVKTDADAALPDTCDRGRTSVALRSFTLLTNGDDQTFLVEGLMEDLGTKMNRFKWLDILRETVDSDTRLDFIVQGSLRAQGSRYRLTVQLSDPRDGRLLWVERFDRESDDLFALQDDLSDAVVGSLEYAIERLRATTVGRKSFEEMDAWECYHRGLSIQYEFDAETNSVAEAHFRRAIELAPDFALAYARLSYAIVISTIYFEAEPVEALLSEARQLAQKAARLDPEDAVVRFALGRVLLACCDYEQSIQQLQCAIELNPNMAQAYCGLGDSLAYAGDLDAAMGYFERAVAVCPNDPYRWAFLSYGATALLFQGDYEAADEWAARAEAMPNAHYWPTAVRAAALAYRGLKSEADAALTRLKEMRPGITCDFVKSRLFYLKDRAQIETYVSGLRLAGLG